MDDVVFQKIQAGKRVWSTLYDCMVDVVRLYKASATVQYWGEGLQEGKLITRRGHPLDKLAASEPQEGGSR